MADAPALESGIGSHGRAAGPVADRRPAYRACPDVPDRVAGRPESSRAGRAQDRRPGRVAGPSRGEARRTGRPEVARSRLGRGPGRRWPVRALCAIGANGGIRRGARAPEVVRADLSVHVHAGRHRARGQRPARGRRGTKLSRHLRHRSAADAEGLGDRPFAWRFRVQPGSIAWDDLFLGRVEIDPSRSGGDFIVARHAVGPSYQLAVVVDDAAMGVNQVIRGSDLATSTPRQIVLYRALGRPLPMFGHVPLVVSADGRRLAKRDNR